MQEDPFAVIIPERTDDLFRAAYPGDGNDAAKELIERYFDLKKWDDEVGLDQSGYDMAVIIIEPSEFAGSYDVSLELAVRATVRRVGDV
jgi:hypothetical protein